MALAETAASRRALARPGPAIGIGRTHTGRACAFVGRGARCHDEVTGADSIDFLGIDWFDVAPLPVDEVRARFHVLPKSELARAAGSVGPWERGGISPFQLAAGRARADRLGVPYDCHGAIPEEDLPEPVTP